MRFKALIKALIKALYKSCLLCLGTAFLPFLAQAQTMVLRVLLNTVDKGDVVAERLAEQDFLLKPEDLLSIGLIKAQGLSVLSAGVPHISLKSIQGVDFSFDENTQSLLINAAPSLLPEQVLAGYKGRSEDAIEPKGNSFFVNYSLMNKSSTDAAGSWDFAGELGWRMGKYLLLTNGNTVLGENGQKKFIRLMSSITRDERESLRRVVLGDFFTPARELGSSVNLGGIGISKLFELDPYLNKYPLQSMSGQAALPSTLDVYLDGKRIRSEKIQPGDFQLRDLQSYGGARDVQLVLRDAFGREQQFNYSFYFTDQPLAEGLQEYSYNLGAMRRNFGKQDSQYGALAATLFHRYGYSNALTLGLRAEASAGFVSLGPSATAVLGQAGVLNLALSHSKISAGTGNIFSLGHSYQYKGFGTSFSWLRETGSYAVLGEPPTVSNRGSQAAASISYQTNDFGAFSLSRSSLRTRDQPLANLAQVSAFNLQSLRDNQVSSLGYSVSLIPGKVSLQARLSRIHDSNLGSNLGSNLSSKRSEFYVGLTYFYDKDYTATATQQGTANGNNRNLQLTKTQPIGEGLGYRLSADKDAGASSQQLGANLQYNAAIALLQADVVHRSQSTNYNTSIAGGLAWVDGMLALGRPINQSFGVVKLADLAGVDVLLNGQVIGQTDAKGRVFIPSMSAYTVSEVSVASHTIPIEYSLAAANVRIRPALRSGMVIDFAAHKIQGFSGKLKSEFDGVLAAVEYREITFSKDDKTYTLQTGRGGEFYVEDFPPGSYADSVLVKNKACYFSLNIPKSEAIFVELGEVICRPEAAEMVEKIEKIEKK